MRDDKLVLDKLSNSGALYLKASKSECLKCDGIKKDMTMDFIALYRVDEVTFEDKAPRKEALENVISSMSIEGINFVYIIMGDNTGVKFYYGVARDFSAEGESRLEISEIGEKILKPSLQGNFRGSVITEIDANERKKILCTIDSLEEAKILEGVPGINKDDEKFQSVDRIIDVMLGDTFALMLIAKPISVTEINRVQESIYNFYNTISPIGKMSVQESEGRSKGTSESTTEGDSVSEAVNSSTAEQKQNSTTFTKSHGQSKGKSSKPSESSLQSTSTEENGSESSQESSSNSVSTTTGETKTTSKSVSKAETLQSGSTLGNATTLEIVNKKVQEWIKYMEEIILPRLDYGFGKGLFVTAAMLLGKDPASLIKLENTIRSVYGGETGNRMPLHAFCTDAEETRLMKRMQIPRIMFEGKLDDEELAIRAACSQLFKEPNQAFLGNWMSSQEISLLAGLPQKEVVGLALREEVEFGLNVNNQMEEPILIGHLVQSGVVLNGENGVSDIPVYFDKSYFDKHIFITGVTGGGKTTTCQKLLLESQNNFLVIEPAKTEYRVLAEKEFPDMLVFTLGKETGAPFRLNPFEFFEGENITSRVDMIKASMEAAFDMDAAIPQILETAIYECYIDKGWDIATNKNSIYENPFADGVYAFPTLGELDKKIEKVVEAQGLTERLRDEYIGSIRARLKGLTVGAKGLMLNTPRSVDFVELLDKKVVLELEYIKSGSEKSLIMGFILGNLSEAIRVKYNQMGKKQINHITLIEEAHRLLSRYMPGDSLNKKQGVEMFSDMLAEVRKYGESLIISDQIPNKLTPEVLKNTNTKIVHKIFAQDDKEAIGNTMALKDEQKEHLSYLACGRAIMMNPGLSKAIQVQIIKNEENDTKRPPLEDEVLRSRIIKYYCQVYKKGIFPGVDVLVEPPSEELVQLYLESLQPRVVRGYYECIHNKKISDAFVKDIRKLHEHSLFKTLVRVICGYCHEKRYLEEYPEIYDDVENLLCCIAEEGKTYAMRDYKNWNKLDSTLDNTLKGGI